MAKRKSSFGGWVIAGLLAIVIFQCSKSADQTNSSAAARPPPATAVARSERAPTPTTIIAKPATASATIEIRYVTASSLNVRERPNTASSIIGRVVQGNQVAVVERRDGWLLVEAATAGRGWVSEQFTSKTRPAPVYRPPAPIAPVYTAPTRSSSRYITGPRGGCYYINRNGNKTYVDRSLCR